MELLFREKSKIGVKKILPLVHLKVLAMGFEILLIIAEFYVAIVNFYKRHLVMTKVTEVDPKIYFGLVSLL
jgi:hypothetical protein